VKSQILQYEEKALHHQQELLVYKRDTEAKILILQAKYNEEISRLNIEKRNAIQDITLKVHKYQESREKIYCNNGEQILNLNSASPQEISRSFTIVRQDTGSTNSKIIKHRRQYSDSVRRTSAIQTLKRTLSSTINTYK